MKPSLITKTLLAMNDAEEMASRLAWLSARSRRKKFAKAAAHYITEARRWGKLLKELCCIFGMLLMEATHAKRVKRGDTRFPGIKRHAQKLGVSRVHLFLVLTGKRTSESLRQRYNELIQAEASPA